MHFRAESWSPVTFNTKLSVKIVNNISQLLPFLCHRKRHLRCCIEPELNRTLFAKILRYWKSTCMRGCSIGKIRKKHSLRCPKNLVQEVFNFKLSFSQSVSNGLNGININVLSQIVALL